LRKGKLERRRTRVKKINKIGGSLKIGSKGSLWSSYFSNDKLLVPQYFKKSISI
jgi:hypothetical protein